MFNSLAKISIFPFIYKYLALKVFCAAFARFLFPLPTNTLGRYDDTAVLFWVRDAVARKRISGSSGAV